MDFHVIEGPPDETVPLKYVEEARPRETGKRREKITAPNLSAPVPYPFSLNLRKIDRAITIRWIWFAPS